MHSVHHTFLTFHGEGLEFGGGQEDERGGEEGEGVPPDRERQQAGGQGGRHPGNRPGQQGLEDHRAEGKMMGWEVS